MDFVIIANAWAAVHDNPTSKHQIARELAAAGHRVLWVEGSGMRTPSMASRHDRGRIVRKISTALRGAVRQDNGIWSIAPLFAPLPQMRAARFFNGLLAVAIAGRWCRRLGFSDPVLVNYVPVFAEAMKRWGEPSKVVYHCVDKWDAFGVYDGDLMRELDAECCRSAGTVIASSAELFENCRKLNPHTALVSHGVDFARFSTALNRELARPPDLPAGKIVGFFGLVSEWVDQELLVDMAKALPDAVVVLVGRNDVDVSKLDAVPNILRLGPRAAGKLPEYVRAFAVGIIPFHVNDLTRAVNPIKLREMLAAGCPVVSADLPEVEAVQKCAPAGAVVLAKNRGEFIAAVKRRVEVGAPEEERRRISDSMRGETWAAKTAEILRLVRQVTFDLGKC